MGSGACPIRSAGDLSAGTRTHVRQSPLHTAPGDRATRLGTSVCQVTRDQKVLDLTAPDMGCNWFLLSCSCDSSGYYRVARGTALIPNETQFPCRH